LHLATTSVGRIRKEKPAPPPEPEEATDSTDRVVTAKYPNHVWHVDLTTVPIGAGFWCSWLPFALPQCWPFCWWVLVAIDHFSRRAVGVGVFANRPDCRAVCARLGQVVHRVGASPKYIVCDRDGVFDCEAFRQWVKRKGSKPPRYGAIGKHGSIAVVERLILTLKQLLRQVPLIPLHRETFRQEMTAIVEWYNEFRPHTTLRGKTPNEVYEGRFPANRQPRIEPRPGWPRGSPCARPWALVGGKPGQRFATTVSFHSKRRYLPTVTLKRVA
jgi:transposase InsO family protein